MKYQNCIFDLYGTLVDIHTDECSPRLWVRMAEVYRRGGAAYRPGELRDAYFRMVRELEQLRLDGLFDGVYLSSDYGCKKPDPRFFHALLSERGIDLASAVMIGNDGVCDIEGAKAVGLSTIYIRSNLSPEEPIPQADHVLPAMDLRRVGQFIEHGV